MLRFLFALLLAVGVASLSGGILAPIVFVVAAVPAVLIGVPLALLFRGLGWTAWPFAVLAGIAAVLPVMDIGLGHRPAEFHPSGRVASNAVVMLGLGAGTGLLVWSIGVYRNPWFATQWTRFPVSMLMVIPIALGGYAYYQALVSRDAFGCVIDYTLADDPRPWRHGLATVASPEGGQFRVGLTTGSSDPAIVGTCMWAKRWRDWDLRGWTYSNFAGRSRRCEPPCPKQESG